MSIVLQSPVQAMPKSSILALFLAFSSFFFFNLLFLTCAALVEAGFILAASFFHLAGPQLCLVVGSPCLFDLATSLALSQSSHVQISESSEGCPLLLLLGI